MGQGAPSTRRGRRLRRVLILIEREGGGGPERVAQEQNSDARHVEFMLRSHVGSPEAADAPPQPKPPLQPQRPWEKLSDDEWAVLSPFVFRHSAAAGRPSATPATRLDAIFWLAAHTLPGRAPPPWAALPEPFGSPTPFPASSAAGPRPASGPSSSGPSPTPTTPASPFSAAWRAGSARAYRRAWRLLGVGGMAPRPALGLPVGAARPFLAAARPRFVRWGGRPLGIAVCHGLGCRAANRRDRP